MSNLLLFDNRHGLSARNPESCANCETESSCRSSPDRPWLCASPFPATSDSRRAQQLNWPQRKSDPEYVPPKRILDTLKSGPQSDIIVNVKRRKLRRTKKFSDCREDEDPSLSFKEEQLFADLDMSTPISTEQLRQLLEDSASEEASNKESRVHSEEPGAATDLKMNCAKPSLKIRLRKLNKKTVICSSPPRAKKGSSETDGSLQVPKDVLPEARGQKEFGKGMRRKRQTCRKQFRHKDITLYKLGAGPEKVSIPKNQAIHKIFARCSSVNAPSPSASKCEIDNPKEEVSEGNLLGDPKSSDSSNKCTKNFTVNNNISSPKNESSSNELAYPNKINFSDTNTEDNQTKLSQENTHTNLVNVELNHKVTAKSKGDIPLLQIRDKSSSGLMSSTKVTTRHQMTNRHEIGKHNLPIRIPERRTSIAEPLRTPPVLNKLPTFLTEKQAENRGNYLKIEVKSDTSEKPEVIYLKSTGSRDKACEITKLKETQLTSTPFVKLCRLPESQTLNNKKATVDIPTEKHDEKSETSEKDVVEVKPIEKDVLNNQSKPNYAEASNSGQTETKEVPRENYETCSPQNLSIKVFKSCSGITDPLKVHRLHHLQNKKIELCSKNRSSNMTPPKDSYYNNHQSLDNPDVLQPTASKMPMDMSEMNYKKSSILQQNLLLRPGYKMDPYRHVPLRGNSSTPEKSPYGSTSPSAVNTDVLHNLPRSMPIIEEANQAFPTVSPRKYRGKRKSADGFDEAAAKLYRGNTYQPYTSYNYPFHLYSGVHQTPPYGSVPPFSISVPPPPYTVCPPVYQPRHPRQPPSGNARSETSGFSSVRPIVQPFLGQESRVPMQPYSLSNIPSPEAYSARMNYEHLMRFNNSVFASRNTLHSNYTTIANNSRVLQSPSPTLPPVPRDFPRHAILPNYIPPFSVPEAHQQPAKLIDSQSTPLALIKNVTTSNCNERIPIISRNEELTITKLPLRENPTNSSHMSVSKGHDIANLIPLSKKADSQRLDKLRSELHNEYLKMSRNNNTKNAGPLRRSPNKMDIPSKPPCDLFEHNSLGNFSHSELASISVSIVKTKEKQTSVQQSKQASTTPTSVLLLSEQIKLLNSDRMATQKSESVKFNTDMKIKTTGNTNCPPITNGAPLPSYDQKSITLQATNTNTNATKDVPHEKLPGSSPSPCSNSDSSTVTDLERESEIEENSSVITIITGEKTPTCDDTTENNDKSTKPSITTLPEEKLQPESVTTETVSQVNDELISGILAQPTTRNEFIKSLHALTFIVNNMLYNSDRISEEEKVKLRCMLEGPMKNFNADAHFPPSPLVLDSDATAKDVEAIVTEHPNSKQSSANESNSDITIKSTKGNEHIEKCETGISQDTQSALENLIVSRKQLDSLIQTTNTEGKDLDKANLSSALPVPTTCAESKEDKGIQAASSSSSVGKPDTDSTAQNVTNPENTAAKSESITLQVSTKPEETQSEILESKTEDICSKINAKTQRSATNENEKGVIKGNDLSSPNRKNTNNVEEHSTEGSRNGAVPKLNKIETTNVEVNKSKPRIVFSSSQKTENASSTDLSNSVQPASEPESSKFSANEHSLNLTTKIVLAPRENDNSSLKSYSKAQQLSPINISESRNTDLRNNIEQTPNKTVEKPSQLRYYRISSSLHSRKSYSKTKDSLMLKHPSSSHTSETPDCVLNLVVNATTTKEKQPQIEKDAMTKSSSSCPRIVCPSQPKILESEIAVPPKLYNRSSASLDEIRDSTTNKSNDVIDLTVESTSEENNHQMTESNVVIQQLASKEHMKDRRKNSKTAKSFQTSSPLCSIDLTSVDHPSTTHRNSTEQNKDSNVENNIMGLDLTAKNGAITHNCSSSGNSVITSNNGGNKKFEHRPTSVSPSSQDRKRHPYTKSPDIEDPNVDKSSSSSNTVICLQNLESTKTITKTETPPIACVALSNHVVEEHHPKIDDPLNTSEDIKEHSCDKQDSGKNVTNTDSSSLSDKNVISSESKSLAGGEVSVKVIQTLHSASNSEMKPSVQNINPKTAHGSDSRNAEENNNNIKTANVSSCNLKTSNVKPVISKGDSTPLVTEGQTPKTKGKLNMEDASTDHHPNSNSGNTTSTSNMALDTNVTVKDVKLHKCDSNAQSSHNLEDSKSNVPQLPPPSSKEANHFNLKTGVPKSQNDLPQQLNNQNPKINPKNRSNAEHQQTVSSAVPHQSANAVRPKVLQTSFSPVQTLHSPNITENRFFQPGNIVQPVHSMENPTMNLLNSPPPSYTSACNFLAGKCQPPIYTSQPIHRTEFVRNVSNSNVPLSTHVIQHSPPPSKKSHQSTNSQASYKNATESQSFPNGKTATITTDSSNQNGPEVRETGEKRAHGIDEPSYFKTKRKRDVSDEKSEGLARPNYNEQALYQQPRVSYQPENRLYGIYPPYPPENMEYPRPRTHPLKEPPLSSDGVVNYSKPSSVLPPNLQTKPSSLNKVADVPSRGLDMRNHTQPRQPVIYNAGDAGNRTNYQISDNFGHAASFRPTNIRDRDFPKNPSPGNFGDVQNSPNSVNARILADLKEKCLRATRPFQSGTSRSPEIAFSNTPHGKVSKENQTHLRINANVPNFSNNISPDYGYFSPLSKNAPTHFEPPVHQHPTSTLYSETNPCQNLQYRRMSSSSQHSAADSLDNYRHLDAPLSNCSSVTPTSSTGSSGHIKHNAIMPPSPLTSPVPTIAQSKGYQAESSLMPQNHNVQDKISSILPKLQQSGTLTPEQYVAEMGMLEKDGCPRPFLEFYSYVTKKQISSNQLPISFRIFLEFQNAGKLKTLEKAFKIYSEKHEKEKKMLTKSN